MPLQMIPEFSPLFEAHPYIICEGGRSGMKSHTIAEVLVTRARSKKLRILCAREIQKSITESVHQLLRDKIKKLNYEAFFTVTKNEIIGRNGSQFLFAGLRTNFSSIKSKEGIDIVWVEEAAKVSRESWKVLLPTIRKEGSQLIVSFNPDQEDDPVLDLKSMPGAVSIVTGWKQNPWLTSKVLAEIRHDYQRDPETAEHVWGGGFNIKSEAQIFAGKYKVEAFEPNPLWLGPYYGADWGFFPDPTVLKKNWLSQDLKRIYIEKESYETKLELDQIVPRWVKDIPEVQVQPSKNQRAAGLTVFNLVQPVVRADCSRPETISHVRAAGINIIKAEKWSGSIEDGVAWLTSREIICHPQCEHSAHELKYYRRKVDPVTGDVLRDIVDANNHTIDSDRYAFQPFINGGESEEIIHLGEENISITPDLDAFDSEYGTGIDQL